MQQPQLRWFASLQHDRGWVEAGSSREEAEAKARQLIFQANVNKEPSDTVQTCAFIGLEAEFGLWPVIDADRVIDNVYNKVMTAVDGTFEGSSRWDFEVTDKHEELLDRMLAQTVKAWFEMCGFKSPKFVKRVGHVRLIR